MLAHTQSPRQPQHPVTDVPDDFEPGSLPVEPDPGPIPIGIPVDPDHEGSVDRVGGSRASSGLTAARRSA